MNIKRILKFIAILTFTLSFAWVSYVLFFQTENKNSNAVTEITTTKLESFTIVYPQEPTKIEPTFIDITSRQRLINLYEPLIKNDAELNIQPALALSWGLIDDTTWEFHLRPNIQFHDGSTLNSDDVIASISRAQTHNESQLTEILRSITNTEKIDDLTFTITTEQPDPLLLQRLALVMIIPSEHEKSPISQPIGTGPYQFSNWQPGENMEFTEFPNYWGQKPQFQKVNMLAILDPIQRVKPLAEGNADFLAFVPHDIALLLIDNDFQVSAIPSLEVQFLIFNTESKILDSPEARRAISLSINQKELIHSLGQFVRPVSQFVSTGIFGFNPKISEHQYNQKEAQEIIKKEKLTDQTIQIHLPLGTEILGEHLRNVLTAINLNPIISYLDGPDFFDSIQKRKADIYFLGFKSDIGDSGDFFDVIVHSTGSFNIANYSDETTDKLIESSMSELDIKSRQKILQNLMSIVIDQEVLGVPLFEYEVLYGYSPNFAYPSRVDGLIYFDDIIINQQ